MSGGNHPPRPAEGPSRLIGVSIRCADVQRPADTFAALLGSRPRYLPVEAGAPATVVFAVGDAQLVLHEQGRGSHASTRAGVETIHVAVPDFDARLAQLRRAGAEVEHSPGMVRVLPSWANGLWVELTSAGQPPETGPVCKVDLDHVALLVRDLQVAVERWSGIVGAAPAMLGPHPLGGSDAARFLLGRRMIEMVTPWPSASSPMRKRLDTAGEGPLALALVARDLGASVRDCEAAGATLVRQPPHVFLHPRDTGGVLVQLTPRLEH